MADAHCDLPLVNSFLSFWPPRGTCELRGAAPNLWFAVVEALGFRVFSFRSSHPAFTALLSTLFGSASSLGVVARRCNKLPDIIFCDRATLPASSRLYWSVWTTPHVFFSHAGDCDLEIWGAPPITSPSPPVPRGWSARSVVLPHSMAGGGTSGRWRLDVWYPPSYPAVLPAPLP